MEQLINELEIQLEKMNRQYQIFPPLRYEDIKYSNSFYPFNKIEYILSLLLSHGIINFNYYVYIRNEYIKRNPYLPLYEMTAPRTFGETWAQGHLKFLVPQLMKPSKDNDPNYSRGKYDFWYNGIRIEVKASRAVKRQSGDTLVTKAISVNSKFGFDMNFQQIKPECCDVFVWIGVWTDLIRYWVLSNSEVKNNKYYSQGQHRGNSGEGQLWLTEKNISEFNIYEANVHNILQKIIEKSNIK